MLFLETPTNLKQTSVYVIGRLGNQIRERGGDLRLMLARNDVLEDLRKNKMQDCLALCEAAVNWHLPQEFLEPPRVGEGRLPVVA